MCVFAFLCHFCHLLRFQNVAFLRLCEALLKRINPSDPRLNLPGGYWEAPKITVENEDVDPV